MKDEGLKGLMLVEDILPSTSTLSVFSLTSVLAARRLGDNFAETYPSAINPAVDIDQGDAIRS